MEKVGCEMKTVTQQIVRCASVALTLAVSSVWPLQSSNALTINLIPATGMSQQAIDGFQAAADIWESQLVDPVTVNINVNYASLGAGILGSASSTGDLFTYSGFKTALTLDITSADDAMAVANLQPGTAMSLYINRTSTNPNGSGSAMPYVDNDGDANNTSIRMTRANARALGLWAASDNTGDASITFNSNFTWDFDRSNGITAGTYDYVGIAVHEIGHALGFISGVDILDGNSPPVYGPFADNLFTYVAPLDMFRYSAASVANNSLDWTADTRNKYFSLNGGVTDSGSFATGVNFGDGRQASHWKDGLGMGVMDPTAAAGELLSISNRDLRAFDVIGWQRIPEPSTVLLVLVGCFGLSRTLRRRKV
jgi:hypothetical protein